MGVTTNSTTGLKPRRSVKIEKPRPLKLSTGDHNLETVLAEMDLVSQCLQSGVWDQRVLYPAITSVCENLKIFGSQLENVYKDQLDKCYIYLRTGCRDDRLSLAARYRLLEIIELRAMNWKPNQNLISYYQSKLQAIEAEEAAMEEQTELAAYMTAPQATPLTTLSMTAPTTPTAAPLYQLQYSAAYPAAPTAPTMLQAPQTLLYAGQQYQSVIPMEHQYAQQAAVQHSQQVVAAVPVAPMLSPGEVVKTSGKFSKPTRIAGKNYCKDEVVIRNQDSGKVMGIKGRRVHMIEELSETIISFQRVAPGARERLVQITGPSEENIAQAKQLIEDTIRRNASPVREAHSLSSGCSSVFSSSPLNGSNSSIASHTDDDNNSLNGCKRNTLVHSLSMGEGSLGGSSCGGDSCMGDYRYTVAHNSHAIRITGSNLGMVRTAKLVLDEYFNGEKNLNNIAQLISSDSSSPPLLVKPATPPATPPPSASSPTGKESSSSAPRGDESPKNGGVGILRQPLFPSSSKDAIEAAEICSSIGSAGARCRRAAFAKTSEERNSNELLVPGPYSREEMLAISALSLSKVTPSTWGDVVKRLPDLVKKGSQYLAGLQETQNEKGEDSINAMPSYLQPGDFVNSVGNWSPKFGSSNGRNDCEGTRSSF